MTIRPEDRFDLVLYHEIEEHFPALLRDIPLGHLWIKGQMWQESRMNPAAVSPVGAAGLMQLMPATDREIDGDLDGFDVVGNVDNGVRYMAALYDKFAEIPTHLERLRFATAAYNGGRGYINLALVFARDAEGLPSSWAGWQRAGRPAGRWQTWAFTRRFLCDPRLVIRGRRPDSRQITDYVEKIEGRYRYYLEETGVRTLA